MKETKKINPKIFKILKMERGLEKKSEAPVHRMSDVDTYLHVQPKEAPSVGVFFRIEWLTALKVCFAEMDDL